jgi:hypothetical protein
MTYSAAAAERATLIAGVSNADLAALILRVSMGVLFLAHAGLKLFIFTPAGTAGYFASLGLPEPLAYLVIAAELFGGIALILGVYPLGVAGAGADPARLDLRPARRGRLLLLERGRRLGIPSLLGGRPRRPGPARRRRLCAEARPRLSPAPAAGLRPAAATFPRSAAMTTATDFFDMTAAPMRIGTVRSRCAISRRFPLSISRSSGSPRSRTDDRRITLGTSSTPLLELAGDPSLAPHDPRGRPGSSTPRS